jgi:hypothetical protein
MAQPFFADPGSRPVNTCEDVIPDSRVVSLTLHTRTRERSGKLGADSSWRALKLVVGADLRRYYSGGCCECSRSPRTPSSSAEHFAQAGDPAQNVYRNTEPPALLTLDPRTASQARPFDDDDRWRARPTRDDVVFGMATAAAFFTTQPSRHNSNAYGFLVFFLIGAGEVGAGSVGAACFGLLPS